MDNIRQRRSIRKYKSQEIPKEQVEAIIEAAVMAPSAKNRQPWKFLVYSSEAKDKLLDVMEKGLKKEADTHEKFPDFRAGLLDAFYTLKVMRQPYSLPRHMTPSPSAGSASQPTA